MNMDRHFSNLIGNLIKYRSQERLSILGIKNNVVKGKSVTYFPIMVWVLILKNRERNFLVWEKPFTSNKKLKGWPFFETDVI